MEAPSEALRWVLILSCLGSGMMAGLFVSFSTFVMKALGSLQPGEGIRAMQAINRFIIRPSFLLVFMGTAVLLAMASYLAAGLAAGFPLVLGATIVYVAACLLSTMAFNVPLNNQLDAADADGEGGHQLWQRYLVVWTNWNHVRSAACVISTVLTAWALTMIWRVS